MFWQRNRKAKHSLADLGGLYHDYAFFGVDNVQLTGMYTLNQQAKAPMITAYIAYAIAKSKRKVSDAVSFTELFCADGFYAMVAARLGCDRCVGIDNDRDNHFGHAQAIAARLGLAKVVFQKREITASTSFEATDIVANIGGLYHVDNPEQILELSYRMAKKYLIVQSVVSLATHADDYYESPAPGWTWGNRFSRASFDTMMKKHAFKIVDQHFNELEGNDRPEDRGSVYYLVQK
jgi:hypothetical protein